MMLYQCPAEDAHPGYDAPVPEERGSSMGARDWALAGLELPALLTYDLGAVKKLSNIAHLICYGDGMGRMCAPRKRQRLDDLEGLAAAWVEHLVAMSTAHSHEERSRTDERSDEMMTPLLTAPIDQVREFVRIVAGKLEHDPRVPFLVWSSFKEIVQPVMLKSSDGKQIELEKLLAIEVANLVVPQLDPEQLVQAMAGALQWRSPESLKSVKAALESPGAEKPKLRGRQSCLFLHVQDSAGKEAVVVL